MMSKSSFLGSLRANGRRRVWLAVVDMLYFFLLLPVMTALFISAQKASMYVTNLEGRMTTDFVRLVSLSGWMGFFTVILALLAAIQGFSYMYSQKKLDLYESMPVPKRQRFLSVYINGIVLYGSAYLINLVLAFVVAEVMGADSMLALEPAVAGFFGHLLLFLAVYHLGILAVMLTGKLMVTVMASGVLLFLDAIWVMLLSVYCQMYFTSFSYYTDDRLQRFMVSPVIHFFQMLERTYVNTPYGEIPPVLWEKFLPTFSYLLVYALVVGAIGYWCFQKKAAESCNRSIAFAGLKAPLKVVLVVTSGILGGALCYGAAQNDGFYLFGLAMGILLCHGLMEVIYDFDIRSVRRGFRSTAVAAVLSLLWFAAFRFDLTGYDRFVPAEKNLARTAFLFQDENIVYYDNELNNRGYREYPLTYMDVEDKAAVLSLAERRMGQEEGNEHGRAALVKYTMTDGREIYRTFLVDYEEDAPLLSSIVGPAYRQCTSLAFDEGWMQHLHAMELHYGNGANRALLEAVDREALLDAYRKDWLAFTYEDFLQEMVAGELQMTYQNTNNYYSESLPVYPSFTNTTAILRAAGAWWDSYVEPEDIEKIVVENSHYSLCSELEQQGETVNYMDYYRTAEIRDAKEIAQLVEALYPQQMYNWYWLPNDALAEDYTVTVYLKNGGIQNQARDRSYRVDGTVLYSLLAEKLPAFVEERTAY